MKALLFGPVMAMPEIVSNESPVLMIATGNCALLGTPTAKDPKFTFAEPNETLGPVVVVLDIIFTKNASFSGGDNWQLAQVS
jgi:hypothetical protein